MRPLNINIEGLYASIKCNPLKPHLHWQNLMEKRLRFRTTGACIIKLITAIFSSFHNKLERLSLNTRLGWRGLPGTNTLAYYGSRKLRP